MGTNLPPEIRALSLRERHAGGVWMERAIRVQLREVLNALAELVGLDLVGHRVVWVLAPGERRPKHIQRDAGGVPAGPVCAVAADAPGIGLTITIGIALTKRHENVVQLVLRFRQLFAK